MHQFVVSKHVGHPTGISQYTKNITLRNLSLMTQEERWVWTTLEWCTRLK